MPLKATLDRGGDRHAFFVLEVDDVDYDRERVQIIVTSGDGSEQTLVFIPQTDDGVFKLLLDRETTDIAIVSTLDKMVGDDTRDVDPAELPCYLIVDTDNYSAVDATLDPSHKAPDYRILVPPGFIVAHPSRDLEYQSTKEPDDTITVNTITVD